jgi:hypothetical protein
VPEVSLPWVRLDSNIASHDKILHVLDEKNGVRAAWMYVCSMGYSGGHGTDGHVPFKALPFIHGTKALGDLLVKHGLFEPDPKGWRIRNWAQRQELEAISEGKRAAQRVGARKANCRRHHGPDCGCWQNGAAA